MTGKASKLTILVAASISVLIAILDAILIAMLVAVAASLWERGAPRSCETRVAIAHPGGDGAPILVVPRACASQREEATWEEEGLQTIKKV